MDGYFNLNDKNDLQDKKSNKIGMSFGKDGGEILKDKVNKIYIFLI